MKYGALPTDHVGPAPVGAVEWLAVCAKSKRRPVIIAPSWFIARDEATMILGCGRSEVEVTQLPRLEPDATIADVVRDANGLGLEAHVVLTPMVASTEMPRRKRRRKKP
ncbi:MAG TPA: hypothetical protein VFT22_27740 [Kofleriaceae bacterium]|nr:hypothetical protein [Kofleriaceae bacterium]